MGTGWNEVTDEVADVLDDLHVGDIVETDLVSTLTVTDVTKRTIDIGESEDQETRHIEFESNYGGKHKVILWNDPAVKAPDGEVRDWDHAVLVKRWDASDRTWMNNTDILTEIEKVDSLTEFEVSLEGHFGATVEADDMESAQAKAIDAISSGSFELVYDKDPEHDFVRRDGDDYVFSFIGYANDMVYAEDWTVAAQKAGVSDRGEAVDVLVSRVVNKDTGEEHTP